MSLSRASERGGEWLGWGRAEAVLADLIDVSHHAGVLAWSHGAKRAPKLQSVYQRPADAEAARPATTAAEYFNKARAGIHQR